MAVLEPIHDELQDPVTADESPGSRGTRGGQVVGHGRPPSGQARRTGPGPRCCRGSGSEVTSGRQRPVARDPRSRAAAASGASSVPGGGVSTLRRRAVGPCATTVRLDAELGWQRRPHPAPTPSTSRASLDQLRQLVRTTPRIRALGDAPQLQRRRRHARCPRIAGADAAPGRPRSGAWPGHGRCRDTLRRPGTEARRGGLRARQPGLAAAHLDRWVGRDRHARVRRPPGEPRERGRRPRARPP